MAKKSEPAPAETARQDDAVQSFIDDLQTAPSGEQVLYGMVKPADTRDGLMFAHPGGCERWIFIPTTAILSIRRSGRIACRGHSHAAAEIELKAPQSDLEKTFASLANLHQANLLSLQSNLQAGDPPDPGCQPPATWKQGGDWNVWGCWQ